MKDKDIEDINKILQQIIKQKEPKEVVLEEMKRYHNKLKEKQNERNTAKS